MASLRVFVLFIFRHYRQSWRQSLLTILGLALGVSVFVSIHLTVGASLKSFKNTVQAVSGKAEWQLVPSGREIDETFFPVLKTHPVVQAAAPVVEFQASLKSWPGQTIWIMGVDFFSETGIRRYSDSLSSLKGEEFLSWLITPRSIALTRIFAARYGIKKGDVLTILVNGRPEKLTVAVLLDAEGPALAWEGHFGLMDIAQAQEVFGKVGVLDRIDLLLTEEGVEKEQIQELNKVIPPGVRLVQPADREKGTERMIRSYQLNLTALSFIAVLVSMYLIYNTASLSVVRRRKELGILRSLGMMPGQVLLLVLFEAAGYGLIGGLIGISGGTLLARLLLDSVSRTITNLYVLVGVREVPFSFMEAGIMTFLSIAFSMASAYFPARQAAKLEPREVIYQRPGLIGLGRTQNRKNLYGGLGLIGLAGLLTGLPSWHHWPIGGFSATLALTLGFSFLLPDFVRAGINRILSLGFRGKGDFLSAWLGMNYLNRYLSRMAVAMAALMIAIAMLISVGLMIRSFRQAVETWISQSVSGDLFIGPVFPSNQVFSQFLDPQVVGEIEKLNGLSDIYHYRGVITELKGFPVRLWSGDLAVIQRYGGLAFLSGNSEKIFQKTLTGGEILVSEVLANQLGLKSGDKLSLMTAEGTHTFSIAGIFYDYRTEGGAVWMDRSLYLKYWKDSRINGVRVYLKDPARFHQVREAIYKKLSGRVSLMIVSNRELRNQILNIFDQTFQITYILEAIAILVAFLGILHSSSISVLFRERELGILKALGALPGQIRQMILTETALMGLFSFLWGGIAGTLLSLILIFVINKQSFGWTVPFHWSWLIYLQTLGIIVIGSILSGWIPAGLAVRKSTREMIREE
ncbi:MAG: ABC transporter permease [Deltaproteobacteria bacterium]|nr:ABC transporter permease [Deltaproteobacteria bacterium]